MSAATVWRVFAMTADAAGATVPIEVAKLWLNCGHDHGTQSEAEACAWEPDDAPIVYAGAVLEVHPTYFTRFAQAKMPWSPPRPLRQSGRNRAWTKAEPPKAGATQLELQIGGDR